MNWIIISAVLIVLLYFIKKFNRSLGIPLLEAEIKTSDGLTYEVKFNRLHPDVVTVEYVKLVLCFIAKSYYISSRDERINIKYFLSQMEEGKDFNSTLEIFSEQIEYNGNGLYEEKGKSITALLMHIDINNRSIRTKIPSTCYPNQFYKSIIALITASIKNLSLIEIEILFKGLKNLSSYYSSSDRANALSSSRTFPNKAFIDASFTYNLPDDLSITK